MQEWAAEEMEGVKLKDRRHKRRLIQMLEQFTQRPAASIPVACENWQATKAAYRFLSSERVAANAILQGHQAKTVERLEAEEWVLVAQDTTELNYTSHKKAGGLGGLRHKGERGLYVHSGLAIDLKGIPLGLVYQETWARELKPERTQDERRWTATSEKESQRWIRTLEVCKQAIPEKKTVVLIADREADMYDLFAAERRGNFHFLIRAVQNRRVTHPAKYLQEAVRSQPVTGQIEVEVGRQGDRPPRKVTLDIRFLSVAIRPPYRGVHRTQAQPIPLQVILAEEVTPPEGETTIVWWLITTLPVENLADAQRCIRWYSFRWLIERFHFVLKSGCRIERLQFALADRLEKAIAVYSIVAWRLLWLTYQARISAEQSCLVALKPHEWQALYCTIHKTTAPPDDPPVLHAAIRWISRLGGFLDRKGDGEPGVQTIWTGLRRLDDIAATWRLLHPAYPSTYG
jgi:hypothetical protein